MIQFSFLLLQDECQNYIRVLAQPDPSNLLVCGTNSFNPKCRTYTTEKESPKSEHVKGKDESKENITNSSEKEEPSFSTGLNDDSQTSEQHEGKFRINHEFPGKGSCPHDPRHNSTAIFTGIYYNAVFLLQYFYKYTNAIWRDYYKI